MNDDTASLPQEKKPEESFDDIQKRFEMLTTNLEIALFSSVPGPDGHFTYVNPVMVHMFEASNEAELFTRQVSDFYKHPEERQQKSDKILAQGFLKNEEIEFVTLKGKPFIGSTSAILKKNADGSVYFDGMIEDITERKKKENDLLKLSRAVEQSPVTVVITDKNGVIEYVNPFFAHITGYTMEEAIGQNPRILQSRETPKEVYEKLWATILGGQIWRGELRNKKKNGELYWESLVISPVTDPHGQITHFIAVKEDITKRKEIEDRLHISEERFTAFMENSPALAWMKDSEFHHVYINKTFSQFFHVTLEEIKSKTDFDLYPREVAEDLHGHDLAIIESGKPAEVEETVPAPDGSKHIWLVYKFPFKDAEGKQMVGGMATDITERKKAEDELRARSNELESMNALMVGREIKMAELKEEIARLKSQ